MNSYCMREMLEKVPEGDWLCEECKCAEETANQKLGKCEVVSIQHFLFFKKLCMILKMSVLQSVKFCSLYYYCSLGSTSFQEPISVLTNL